MAWSMTRESFLERNRITEDQWVASGADWDVLKAIAEDHISRKQSLSSTAEFVAGRIRTFPGVHSVRWRVKDVEHLLEKIVRKKLDNKKESEKYKDVSKENYFKVVTDLVGVRAIHLFKDEWVNIGSEIMATWDQEEKPTFYYRGGDSLSRESQLEDINPKEHPSGYRSVHYIIKTMPENREILMEVQVRTIFEEGWSEIDHHVRYPNFSEDKNVGVFLTIFNRLAGSADEMGSYVKKLTKALSELEREKDNVTLERDEALERMTGALEKLAEVERKDSESSAIIESLKRDLENLRASSKLASDITAMERFSEADQDGWRDLLGGSSVSIALHRARQSINSSRDLFGERIIKFTEK